MYANGVVINFVRGDKIFQRGPNISLQSRSFMAEGRNECSSSHWWDRECMRLEKLRALDGISGEV